MIHHVTVNKLKIFYDEQTNGGGRESIKDSLDAVHLLLEDKPSCKRVMEWCCGPGYWGFGLLGLDIFNIDKAVFVDIYDGAEQYVNETISYNKLSNASFLLSDNFNSVPKQQFDLIIGNPPHFCIDPFSSYYDDPRKYKDENWSIHRNFFENASNFLSDTGCIILQENVWGSSPNVFKSMIEENGLTIQHSLRSSKFSNELWYMKIVKNEK